MCKSNTSEEKPEADFCSYTESFCVIKVCFSLCAAVDHIKIVF